MSRTLRSLSTLFCAGIVAALPSAPARAQAPRGDDDARPQVRAQARTSGEDEQIRRRIEWFFSTRRDGAVSDTERSRLRRLAADETARRLAAAGDTRGIGTDSANVWEEMGPSSSTFGGWAFGNVAGRITAIARDAARNILYVSGAAGGVWKSLDDGGTWTPLFSAVATQTVGALAIDPNDPDVLWAGTGDFVEGCEGYFGIGLLRSADGGATWQARNGTASNTLEDLSSFASVVVDPRNSSHLVVGGIVRGCSSGTQLTGGLFTTTDAGINWTQRIADTEIHEIAQDPATQNTWWAATNRGIYKSTNDAVTWVLQTASGLPNGSTGRTELAIAPSNPQTVYALFASGSSGTEFWRTTNGGSTWTKMTSGGSACDGQCWYNMAVRVHPTNASVVYRGTVHIFKSLDGGASWTDLSNAWGPSQKVHQDTHVLVTSPENPEWLYVGCDGGVWKSINGGSSFAGLNGNLNLTQFYAIGVHPTDSGILCGGAQDNSSLARAGASDTWDLQEVTGDGFVCHIDPVNPSYAYITSYPGSFPAIYRSTTGPFGSFSVITGGGSGITGGERIGWVTPYVLDPRSPNVLYLGTHRVYRSSDHGTTWSPVGPSDITGGSGNVSVLEVHRNYSEVVWAGTTSGRVWRSGSSGQSWTDLTAGLPARAVNDVAVDPTQAERAFVAVGGFGTAHLWEHTGSGTWTARGGGLPNVPANSVLALTATDIVVGTDVGVFRSVDGGVSFSPFMTGLPQGLVITDLQFNAASSRLTAGTYGRGAWQAELDPVPAMVLFDGFEAPLTQVDGDGDANVEPGETWQIRPILRNGGGQGALGVTARLATASPGVTVALPDSRSFGDLAAGVSAPSATPYTFTVDPAFSCGGSLAFDVVDIASSTPPGTFPARLGAVSLAVVDHFAPDDVTTLVDEDFDPAPPSGWTHEKITPVLAGCTGQNYKDEWKFATKDAGHGQSYHCGNGPSASYGTVNHAWLRIGGKDSTNGPGIAIPANAATASLTLTHWYSTQTNQDGANVQIDAVDDGLDVYTPLVPQNGYPGSILSGLCNGLEGKPVFTGSSGGWITSTFDLTPHLGKTVYLAFVFGSDRISGAFEGWYLDLARVEARSPGAPVCHVTRWPGIVDVTATFDRLGDGSIQAAWPQACNAVSVPGQTYSIQAGDLDALVSSGTYGHAPVGGQCSLASPATFTPGPGNEYYLVVPNLSGAREGGPGSSSTAARPQTSAACGGQHVEGCP